ncbi:uncharacterized protein LOC107045010 [Diachasma alloeum]|uniref:uncharacterized protein LOC107045010 n=1 Tax=Diachasma alloeum TaxID=454923 RepID=UPI0007382C1D|nr:uncharacterized protein LOC107045010 [Diachasma alloeum]
MGLFKVVPHDESRRIFIRAETIAEAITSAKEKLQLTGEKYQLVLQEDGTEIDNDGVLLEMANNSAITLTLMVLPDAVKYATGLVQPSTSGVTAAVASSPTVQSQPAREDDRNLWDTFSPALLERCREEYM